MQNNKDDQYDVTIGFLNMPRPQKPQESQLPIGQPAAPPVPAASAVPPVNNVQPTPVVNPAPAVNPAQSVFPANSYRGPVIEDDDSEKTIGMFSYMRPPVNKSAQTAAVPPMNSAQPVAAVPPVSNIPQPTALVGNEPKPQEDMFEKTVGMFSGIPPISHTATRPAAAVPPVQPTPPVQPVTLAQTTAHVQSVAQDVKNDSSKIVGEYPAYSTTDQTVSSGQTGTAVKPNIGGIVLLVLGLVYIVFNIVVLISGFPFAIVFMIIGIALVVAGIKRIKGQ